ncbi:L-histidine N(alpha)-methyltransferase [Occallatibacter riparius]|uniref:L-histidine N(Alpha)-methyltransferase n=1 Tax=Occallatibacter riparius TaxID=1002689 RepID=A0A9J7BX80_9BACT|nr:L-histidine N(alpha)-methyltransferase [Occallatibacter riparius]UWZ85709.1 L-histidine N(alpha)-methyltransferase [Occallatibacter riparius]
MTTISLPLNSLQPDKRMAAAVTEGLVSQPKWLPSWLFYDAAGSRLFDQITELPEYYVTRTERGILSQRAEEIVAAAAGNEALQLVELGAGSCDKTRILLRAAVERQDTVLYEPVDVSATALAEAQQRIEAEIPGVLVSPRVEDYTHAFTLDPPLFGHRRMVIYIGSSIGNFEPHEAAGLLRNVRSALRAGDSILLGVDLVKDQSTLLDAYDDAAGVTADFNKNILVRLNREFGANFDLDAFAHRAVWNPTHSRIEMHLESRIGQAVQIPNLELNLCFRRGETIHTENSYKYRPGQAEALLRSAGFGAEHTWTDERGWFGVHLAAAV